MALALKKVVQYSPNWVKNQQRMASTSNQETYRVDIDGRLTIDILRHVRPLQPLRSMRPFSTQGRGVGETGLLMSVLEHTTKGLNSQACDSQQAELSRRKCLLKCMPCANAESWLAWCLERIIGLNGKIERRELQVLTACSLASFSLSDCVLSLLGQTMEVIPPPVLATLANLGASKAKHEDNLPGQDSTFPHSLLHRRSCCKVCLHGYQRPGAGKKYPFRWGQAASKVSYGAFAALHVESVRRTQGPWKSIQGITRKYFMGRY